MRCGKGCLGFLLNEIFSRNPHECAVAKVVPNLGHPCCNVATRTNALWQRCAMVNRCRSGVVATRANALWQSHAIVVPEPEAPKI